MFKLTSQHKGYWSKRKIDWNQHYLSTWDHPHRQIIIQALKSIPWLSLWEAGCGPGPNLVKITKEFPGHQLGGSDINEDAIALARTTFTGARFNVESIQDMFLSDSSVDVVLSDAALIYIGPRNIRRTLTEYVRIARNHLVLCEFHSTSLWKRWWFRLKTGYNVYNYQALLEQLGAYDIQMVKIPPSYWPGCMPGDGWYDYGYVIMCKLPNK